MNPMIDLKDACQCRKYTAGAVIDEGGGNTWHHTPYSSTGLSLSCHSLAACMTKCPLFEPVEGIYEKSPLVQGRKDDIGKLPYDLLPWGAVSQVVAVLQYGAKKYAPDNWKQVKDWRRRYFSAACRHLISWVTGEKLDPETGLHHLAHAACCVIFMIELDK